MIVSLKKKIFKRPINRCSSSVVIREMQNQPQHGNITSKNAEIKGLTMPSILFIINGTPPAGETSSVLIVSALRNSKCFNRVLLCFISYFQLNCKLLERRMLKLNWTLYFIKSNIFPLPVRKLKSTRAV